MTDQQLMLQSQVSEEAKDRNSVIIAAVLGVLSVVMTAASFLVSPEGIEATGSIWAVGLLALASFTAIFFIRRGWRIRAMTGLAVVTALIWAYFITQTEGLGILLGIMILVIPPMMIAQASSLRFTSYFAIATTMLGIAVIWLDGVLPAERPDVPRGLTAFSLLAVFLLVVIVGHFASRQILRQSLSNRLFVFIGGAILLAVLAIGIGVSLVTARSIIKEVGSNTNTLSQLQAIALGEMLSQHVGSVTALTLNDVIQSEVRDHSGFYPNNEAIVDALIEEQEEEWRNYLRGPFSSDIELNPAVEESLQLFVRSFPEYTQILVVDKEGSLVSALYPPNQFNFRETEWWKTAYQIGFGGTYIGEPFYSAGLDSYIIEVAAPIRAKGYDGGPAQVQGAIYAAFKIDPLLATLSDMVTDADGLIEIHFSDTREMEIHPGYEYHLHELTDQDRATLHALEMSSAPYVIGEQDGERTFQSATAVTTFSENTIIKKLNWVLVTHRRERTALQPLAAQNRTSVIIGALVFLIITFAAVGFGQRMTRPLNELSETAVRIASGDLDARAEIHTEDELGVLARSFNMMTNRLEEMVQNLEARVDERTRMLRTSTEVSRDLSTILDANELIRAVVNQVRDAFNFYHAHIYLVDEETNDLVMASGTGEAGRKMLEAGHKIPKGKGLVGRAARTNSIMFVADVTKEKDWLPNPLLPETVTEVAVPISIGDKVLGVLDVQHNVAGGLKEEDADLLLSIADQVAVALQNAENYARAQRQAEQEARLNEISSKIAQTTDVESALQVAVRELGRVLQAEQAVVELLNGKNGQNGNGRSS
jgi:putative methionine-R-sulfoxide reductase with GAF domain